MLEKKLQEELNRFNAINKYGKKMITEQDAPPVPPAEPTAAPTSGDTTTPPPADPSSATPPVDPTDPTLGGTPPDPTADTAASEPTDNTEEIDITDLVNMTKNIKNDLENSKQDNSAVIGKMDDVFSKLSGLEAKLGEMDAVIAKIDQLGAKVEEMKPETPQEKLEMRSLDSYPFSQKPNDFFSQKQAEMRATGKNEYILTKDDIQNYSPEQVKQSFNPDNDEDEQTDSYKF